MKTWKQMRTIVQVVSEMIEHLAGDRYCLLQKLYNIKVRVLLILKVGSLMPVQSILYAGVPGI